MSLLEVLWALQIAMAAVVAFIWVVSLVLHRRARRELESFLAGELSRPELPKDIVAEPIEGWRVLIVHPFTMMEGERKGQTFAVLRSMNGTIWSCREMTAACWMHRMGHDDEGAPSSGCTCGLYMCRTPQEVVQRTGEGPSRAVVLARVLAWGKIIEHEHGYRAEHMRLEEIVFSAAVPQAIMLAVGDMYGVPVGWAHGWEPQE